MKSGRPGDSWTPRPALLRVTEAAAIAGCGRTVAYEMVRRGVWPTVNTPYGRRILSDGLLVWIESLKEQG